MDADRATDCWGGPEQGRCQWGRPRDGEDYAANLQANIEALAQRLKAQRYRAKLVRRCYMPKANGTERPLGMPALEDTLVQLACAKLLTAIYEQDFWSAVTAIDPDAGRWMRSEPSPSTCQYGRYGYLVEADIQGFFDHMDHAWLLDMLRVRIDARALLKPHPQWLKAGCGDGWTGHPPRDRDTPRRHGVTRPGHGSLHYALDLWFDKVVKAHGRGEALLCRYADDWVCAFRYQDDAERFYRVLPQRLKTFNLQVAPEKTHLRRLSRFHPSMKRRVTFLGFEFAWMPDRHGVPRVMRRTARKKLQAACQRLTAWIKHHRHLPERECFQRLNARLRGHYNYYGVRGNSRSRTRFFRWAMDCTFKWLNRRGGKQSSYTWEQLPGSSTASR